MNQITSPPKIEIIPSSAPFSEAQRSWLNGFFAGLLSETVTPLSTEQGTAVMQGPADEADDGEAPWHDQTLLIADRMKLAEGHPLRRRMMAAMAQQDCGQCGYNCHDYSQAIASKAEGRLNLCVPGGKETARMLKTLHEELDKAPVSTPGPAAAPVAEPGRSRDNPTPATFLSRRLLNKNGSEKETWHIEFDLSGINLFHHRHANRQLVNALHRKMIVKIKRSRVSGLEHYCRDSHLTLGSRRYLLDLVLQFPVLPFSVLRLLPLTAAGVLTSAWCVFAGVGAS
jgi:hypothetical protein